MFGSSSIFGQSAGAAFGSQSSFGQTNVINSLFAPKPFGTSNAFGSQSGGSLFGSISTGVFGQPSSLSSTPAFGSGSTPGFGSSTPAFGISSPAFGISSSPFGGSSAFGGFGSSTQTSPFGNSSQQSQPAFGSNMFCSSPSFGASSQPAFGASSSSVFGSSSTPAFGSSGTPGTPSFGTPGASTFGSTPTQTFGNTGTGFGVSSTAAVGSGTSGSTSTSAFGGATTFGASSAPAFGATTTPAFGAPTIAAFGSAPAFGAASTPSFGSSSASSFNFGSTSAFGQSNSAFGSSAIGSAPSPFGSQCSSFGSQASTPATFGGGGFGQLTLGGQRGGSRVASYGATPDTDSGSSTQAGGKLCSISGMPVFKEKSHEELRWEDYQHGDRGGPDPVVQSNAGTSFGASAAQSNPFSSSAFGQSSANLFSASVSSNPFSSKASGFGTTGFRASSVPTLGGTSTPAFGSTSAPTSSIFASSTPAFGSNTSPALFGTPSSSGIGSSSLFGSTPIQGTVTSLGSTSPFGNTQSSPLFQSAEPSLGQTGVAGQSASSFGQTGGFGQPSISSAPSTGFGTNLFSSKPSFSTSNQLGFPQSTPSLSTPFQPTLPTQTSSALNFGSLGQTQTAGTGSYGSGSSILGQGLGQSSANQNSAVAQPVAVTNPFGTLPATPQMSIVNSGILPVIQYGISNMPVVDKPAPIRISPLLTSRHLSQRRIRIPVRKYQPKTDGSRVPFFSDNEVSNTAREDALFIPRKNPRALIIQPADHWTTKSPIKEACPVAHENGKPSEDHVHIPNGSVTAGKNGHRVGGAAVVCEDGVNIEAMMPKLQHSDYYTEPRIHELAAEERAEPGFCRHVENFVVGRHGYGSIKFLGKTDVRCLDLDSLIQFNSREVIVYTDESKKPPVGQGLNKPAEVTLLNIKCFDKKTGKQILEGSRIEKYMEMLKKKAEEQGAEFLSYDPFNGEWKFRVNHFSKYMFYDEDESAIDVATTGAVF